MMKLRPRLMRSILDQVSLFQMREELSLDFKEDLTVMVMSLLDLGTWQFLERILIVRQVQLLEHLQKIKLKLKAQEPRTESGQQQDQTAQIVVMAGIRRGKVAKSNSIGLNMV